MAYIHCCFKFIEHSNHLFNNSDSVASPAIEVKIESVPTKETMISDKIVPVSNLSFFKHCIDQKNDESLTKKIMDLDHKCKTEIQNVVKTHDNDNFVLTHMHINTHKAIVKMIELFENNVTCDF